MCIRLSQNKVQCVECLYGNEGTCHPLQQFDSLTFLMVFALLMITMDTYTTKCLFWVLVFLWGLLKIGKQYFRSHPVNSYRLKDDLLPNWI